MLALLDDVAARADDEPRLRVVLDRLIERTQRRYPDIASRSRSLRYRRFDRPHIERARAETSARMRALLAALAGPAPAPGLVDELVACPFPLLPILADEDPLDWASDPFPLLEVLTRRYYSIRELGDMRRESGGLLRTSYVRHDRTVHVLAGWVDGGFDDALEPRGRGEPRRRRTGHRRRRSVHGAPDRHDRSRSTSWREALGRVELPASGAARRGHRVPPDGRHEVFTFRRPDNDGVRPYWMADPGTGTSLRPTSVAVRGGRPVPGAAPDDRPPAPDVAALELQDHPPAVER